MMRILVLALALAACSPAVQTAAPAEGEACAADDQQVVAQMFFGRNIGEEVGGVSEEEWEAFVAAEITPRFPSGFTVADAQGQWRDQTTQAIGREPSKLLIVALSDEAGRQALDEIADAYKQQFQQQGVLMVLERSCVTYE